MKNTYIKILGIVSMTSLLLFSCKKEGENIFNMFDDVKVNYHSNSPYAVTDYKEVNPQDSVYLEYTITSANKDMAVVCVFENGSGTPFVKTMLKPSEKRDYTGVVKLKMSNKVGKTTYRVWALDSRGVYMGDGYKSVTVEVKSDFKYWSGRKLYVSGFVDKNGSFDPFKNEKSYYSLTTGETFSYIEGNTNSDKIDFGAAHVFDESKTGDDRFAVSLYSINANPIKVPHYDVSQWIDKGTLFSTPKSGGTTFTNSLRTGAQIIDAAKKAKPTLKLATGLKTGYLFYFLTKKGEYGAVYVNFFRFVDGVPTIGIDVKIVPETP